MDDDELARLAEVAAQIAENENHWRSVAREKAEPATLARLRAAWDRYAEEVGVILISK